MEHVVTATPACSGLEEAAEALAQVLARHGIATVHGARPQYLNNRLNGYDWAALSEVAVHAHGRPLTVPPRDCLRFRLATADEVTRLRGLLAGLVDPRVRPNRRRTPLQHLVDAWTGRVTLRRVEGVHLHPADEDEVVAAGFVAGFAGAFAEGRPAWDVVETSGRLQYRQLVEATVPAPAAARVVHRLRTCPVAGTADGAGGLSVLRMTCCEQPG